MSDSDGDRRGVGLLRSAPFLSLTLMLGSVVLTLVAFHLAGGRERRTETGILSEAFVVITEGCSAGGSLQPFDSYDPDLDYESSSERGRSHTACSTDMSNAALESYLGWGALAGFGLSVLLFTVRVGQWIAKPGDRLPRALVVSGLLYLTSVFLFISALSLFTLDLGIMGSSSPPDVFDLATLVYALCGLTTFVAAPLMLFIRS